MIALIKQKYNYLWLDLVRLLDGQLINLYYPSINLTESFLQVWNAGNI